MSDFNVTFQEYQSFIQNSWSCLVLELTIHSTKWPRKLSLGRHSYQHISLFLSKHKYVAMVIKLKIITSQSIVEVTIHNSSLTCLFSCNFYFVYFFVSFVVKWKCKTHLSSVHDSLCKDCLISHVLLHPPSIPHL